MIGVDRHHGGRVDPLLTVQHICDRLQVSDQTVRRWIKAKQLPATNLGGKAGYRVKAADLAAFLEARRSTPSGAAPTPPACASGP